MSSYPTTTLLPPSLSRWCPCTLPLPESDEEIIMMCFRVDQHLDDLWSDYLVYCGLVPKPEAIKIFSIIFAEMDFFETIKERLIEKISTKDLHRDVL